MKKFKTNTNSKILKRKGFSLLELLMIVAVVGVLGSLSFPAYRNFQLSADLDSATEKVSASLRRAKILSQAMKEDSSWGVALQSGQATVFKGESFGSRDISFDEAVDIQNNISFSGLSEVVFEKNSGFPESTGAIIISSQNGNFKEVSLNNLGLISYE